MRRWLYVMMAVAGLVHAAWAQGQAGAVTESTDPARAAAVERKAQELKRRAAAGEVAPGVGLVRGLTAQGDRFLSGGITVGDRVSMHAERQRYGLWVATVAKPSGAYLTDARLRIVRAAGDRAVVVERTMDGPWFMVALPAGRYELSVSLQAEGAERAQTLTQRVVVPATGQRQAVFRFASTAEVSPEMRSPFQGNPFGKPGG